MRMGVGVGLKGTEHNARQMLEALLRSDGNTRGHYRADMGVTGGLTVSSWANQLGSAPSLAQATGLNRPVYLSYDGERYAYLPGAASNYFSTPNAAANRITGNIDIRAQIAPDDWTPSAYKCIVSKDYTPTTLAYSLFLDTGSTGKLLFAKSTDGTSGVPALSTVGTGFTDGTTHWVRVTYVASSGLVTFYTSEDGSTWTQLGNTVTIASGNIFAGSDQVRIGAQGVSSWNYLGKIYRVQIYNGIDGSLAVDFNPSLSSETTTNGATWTSATGEIWTQNNSGASLAQIVGSAQLLGDGTNHVMQTAGFTLDQPFTWYMVTKQISSTNQDVLLAGVAGDISLYQFNNGIQLYGGSIAAANAGLAIGSYGVIAVVVNGASSLIQINGGTPTTGDPGAANPGGLTFMASKFLNSRGNLQTKEIIVRAGADSANYRSLVYKYARGALVTP